MGVGASAMDSSELWGVTSGMGLTHSWGFFTVRSNLSADKTWVSLCRPLGSLESDTTQTSAFRRVFGPLNGMEVLNAEKCVLADLSELAPYAIHGLLATHFLDLGCVLPFELVAVEPMDTSGPGRPLA